MQRSNAVEKDAWNVIRWDHAADPDACEDEK